MKAFITEAWRHREGIDPDFDILRAEVTGMRNNCASRTACIAAAVLVVALGGVLGATQATQPAPRRPADTKRAIPVKNHVPTGAAEFKGAVIKLEVIDAVDVRRSGGGWRTTIAVRFKNPRSDRVRCSLRVYFDGESFATIENIDLPDGETDLTVIGAYGGEGKRAGQLSKLTATASNIRIGG